MKGKKETEASEPKPNGPDAQDKLAKPQGKPLKKPKKKKLP